MMDFQGYTMTAVDTDIAPVEKMFAVNVFGPMRMVRYFHREIIATKGIIINIGSIGGICPFVFGASYNASKAALHHYGNTLRVEMLPFGSVQADDPYGQELLRANCIIAKCAGDECHLW